MALVIDIKVTPSSGTQKCTVDKSNTLKISVKNPPEKGKANAELLKLLSKKLGIAQETLEGEELDALFDEPTPPLEATPIS